MNPMLHAKCCRNSLHHAHSSHSEVLPADPYRPQCPPCTSEDPVSPSKRWKSSIACRSATARCSAFDAVSSDRYCSASHSTSANRLNALHK